MIVEKRRIKESVLLKVQGTVKLGESAEFLVQSLERVLENEQGHALLDLEHINYIDSTGIGELVAYLGRFQQRDRKLILIRPSERIVRLLKVAQLLGLFSIYDSAEAAVAEETAGAAN